MVPHSRWACPTCRVGVVALGPGMGRYDAVGGGFDPSGGGVLTPAGQPSPCLTDTGFHVGVDPGVPVRSGRAQGMAFKVSFASPQAFGRRACARGD